MKTDFLIVGGGIAGLSAANRLADEGADVTLLEAGTYPAQKICGEFLSPEALPILQKWGIPTAAPITSLTLASSNNRWCMDLPKPTATILRYAFDEALAERAEECGANIKTGARVEKIDASKSFVVTLTTGEKWESPNLLMSTGRLTGLNQPKFRYIGAKAHFEGVDIPNQLMMHLLPGAYFGMAPIGKNRMNVAGIIACTHEEALNPKATLTSFLERSKLTHLEGAKLLFDDWLTGPVPEFGLRTLPDWPNSYFMGDAAGVIPPATGNGLAMGLTSGILAAEYALKGQPEAYRSRWNKEYRRRISNGMFLHRLFLTPWLSRAIPSVSRVFPSLPRYFYRATRDSSA